MGIVNRFANRKTKAAGGTQEGIWGLGVQVAKIWEKYLMLPFDRENITPDVLVGGNQETGTLENQKMATQRYCTQVEDVAIGEDSQATLGAWITERAWQNPASSDEFYEILVDVQLRESQIPWMEKALTETEAFLKQEGFNQLEPNLEVGYDSTDLVENPDIRRNGPFASIHAMWRKHISAGSVDALSV